MRHCPKSPRPATLLLLAAALAQTACHPATWATAPTGTPSPPGAGLFPRAVVTKEQVDEAVTIERALAEHYVTDAPAGTPWFEVLSGNSRVLVVAPHATDQMREGQPKRADAGTGSLAVMLNRLAGTPVIYTTARSPSDPNFYDDNDFKRRLEELLRELRPALVLDLHASHSSRPYDVDFGTMGGEALAGRPRHLIRLADRLRDEGLTNFSQDYFAASRNETVTKWVSGRGVPCIQCEFSATWMLPPDAVADKSLQQHRFAQLLQGLVRFVVEIDSARTEAPGNHGLQHVAAPRPAVEIDSDREPAQIIEITRKAGRELRS